VLFTKNSYFFALFHNIPIAVAILKLNRSVCSSLPISFLKIYLRIACENTGDMSLGKSLKAENVHMRVKSTLAGYLGRFPENVHTELTNPHNQYLISESTIIVAIGVLE
jgi:hypothetical protein